MKQLIASFHNQQIIKKDGRNYLVIPMTDHFHSTDPVILRQAVNAICDVVNWNGSDPITKIVSEEERGGFIAVCVALQRNLPFSLAKQNPVHLPGEIGIKFKMSYNDNMTLFLNGIEKKDRVILIDDMIDTGGTVIAMIQAVKQAGVEIKDIVCLAEKVEMGGVARIEKETGYKVKTILKLDTSGTKSKVIGTCFDEIRSE
jgi:adenine/guanine phosphoribosyltransferase-like PRPP-binding protein